MENTPTLQDVISNHSVFSVPFVGLGTWFQDDSTSREEISNITLIKQAIQSAVDQGYRLFDTADVYSSQYIVLEELKKYALFHSTEKFYIIAKTHYVNVQLRMSGYKDDLVDIKHPFPDNVVLIGMIHFAGTMQEDALHEAWKDMNEILHDNSSNVEYIGVSNLYPNKMKKLIQFCSESGLQLPHFNQIEIAPGAPEYEYVQYMQANKIVPIAYSSLRIIPSFFSFDVDYQDEDELETLPSLFDKLRIYLSSQGNSTVTLQQTILIWLQKRGIIVTPCSKDSHRQSENLNTLHLLQSSSVVISDEMQIYMREQLDKIGIDMCLTEEADQAKENDNADA